MGTERERLHAARCRWLCTVLYLGGLRAAEVAGTAMGAFFCRRDAQGIERWWLEVIGKGSKPRLVPATDELVAERARYQRAHGLPPTPAGGSPPTSAAGHRPREPREGLVARRTAFDHQGSVGMAATRGPEWAAQAEVLTSASAHWLRHTAGSHMSDRQVDLRHVRDNFGHASIATTSIYLHTEDDARHEATQDKHRDKVREHSSQCFPEIVLTFNTLNNRALSHHHARCRKGLLSSE